MPVSKEYGEAQYFGTHRVSSYTVWARYLAGAERRLFAYADDPIYDLGEPFPEEIPFVTNLFNPSSPEAEMDGYWEREDLHTPDEDDPLRLAASWSINPEGLGELNLPASVGVVGRLPTT